MKVLIIGSGGREHALGWGITQTCKEDVELNFAPGNPGTSQIGKNIPVDATDIEELAAFVKKEGVGLTLVGPEVPLSKGIVDYFQKEDLRIFGPTQGAAEIESSKNFAKEIMVAAGVPTGGYNFYRKGEAALKAIDESPAPYVIKEDGLAAGKGVTVTEDKEVAKDAIISAFKDGGEGVVIEEFLSGKEASLIVMTDGERIVPLPTAHDYKRIGDGDTGLNTGGMGTVSPTPHLTKEQYELAIETVIKPTLVELTKRGMPFKGFLYAGLMVQPDGDIKVIEFNARMGDPEAQVLMRRWQGDLLTTLIALCDGTELPELQEPIKDSAVCLILASDGYPESSRKGDLISGIEKADALGGCAVFHAGTGFTDDGAIVTNGGRVLAVTATGETQPEARHKAYQALEHIEFSGAQYRSDIAL